MPKNELRHIDLKAALKTVETIAISENYAIKAKGYIEIIELIKLLQLIGFNVISRIRVKVFISTKTVQSVWGATPCIDYYNLVQNKFMDAFGCELIDYIELVIPKGYENVFSEQELNELPIHFSDEEKYIGENTTAMLKLTFLKKRNKYEKLLNKPHRDRAIVSFIHLLRIWHDSQ